MVHNHRENFSNYHTHGNPHTFVHHNQGLAYGNHSHHHIDNGCDPLCCGILLAGLTCLNPRLAFACILAIGAIIIFSCLVSLAMSVTGETLLSLFLIGLVIGGLAMICDRNNGGCYPIERADNHENLGNHLFRP